MSAILETWTIYDHPADRPDKFVLRKFEVHQSEVIPTAEAYMADDVEALRSMMIRRGLVKLLRNAEDHPSVMETWI